jgi:hypothetical protein
MEYYLTALTFVKDSTLSVSPGKLEFFLTMFHSPPPLILVNDSTLGVSWVGKFLTQVLLINGALVGKVFVI